MKKSTQPRHMAHPQWLSFANKAGMDGGVKGGGKLQAVQSWTFLCFLRFSNFNLARDMDVEV